MNIIFSVIEYLGQDECYGISENVEILKGKHKLSNNFFENLKRYKRSYLLKKKLKNG